MFILEELWNGELAPCERRFREGGEYDGLLRQLVELEDKLQRLVMLPSGLYGASQ